MTKEERKQICEWLYNGARMLMDFRDYLSKDPNVTGDYPNLVGEYYCALRKFFADELENF